MGTGPEGSFHERHQDCRREAIVLGDGARLEVPLVSPIYSSRGPRMVEFTVPMCAVDSISAQTLSSERQDGVTSGSYLMDVA